MKDESTGNRYLRAVGKKGVEDMGWLVKDLHEELKSWGAHGRRQWKHYYQDGRRIIDCGSERCISEIPRRDCYTRSATYWKKPCAWVG